METRKADVAIVGAGIVGLAHAYAAASRGCSVVVFDRDPLARGASVRNFGMIWPIGQPPGALLDMALRSRRIWCDVLGQAHLPHSPTGSLHVVYRDDEAAVAREFAQLAPQHGYDCRWLDPAQVLDRSPAVRPEGLIGALWSATEMTVDPRQVMSELPRFLAARHCVALRYGTAVRAISHPFVDAGTERWQAERIFVCGGDEFGAVYPAIFDSSGITRCKLQMMRTAPQPNGWQLGPSLAAGLTLRYYPSFELCPTLPALKRRIASETPEFDRLGIHVMLSQTPLGEITIGDSHEYGLAIDPFDKPQIDEIILRYLASFARLPDSAIVQRWHGVYAKHPSLSYFLATPEPGVSIVTVTAGVGMTLSFGLADQNLEGIA